MPRLVVPFDEDQFTMTPGFENVTTLDSARVATGGAAGGAPRSRPGPTRQQSNEEAMRYFREDWDVGWAAPKYTIAPYKPRARSTGRFYS